MSLGDVAEDSLVRLGCGRPRSSANVMNTLLRSWLVLRIRATISAGCNTRGLCVANTGIPRINESSPKVMATIRRSNVPLSWTRSFNRPVGTSVIDFLGMEPSKCLQESRWPWIRRSNAHLPS